MRDRQDGVQQTRHEVAGRVQARAGRATHGGHEAPHNEADDDGGGGVILLAPSQGQAAQGAEDEHQGAEHLVEEVVDLLVVRVSGAEGAQNRLGVLGLLVVRVVSDVDDELAEQAPSSWATMYGSTSLHGNRPLTAWAMVMAGLMCAPETLPNMSTGNMTPKP